MYLVRKKLKMDYIGKWTGLLVGRHLGFQNTADNVSEKIS